MQKFKEKRIYLLLIGKTDMIKYLSTFFFLSICTTGGLFAQTSSPEITADEIKAHVKYLSSDELEGRGSGTAGNTKAAEYLAEQFRSYGLQPAGVNGTYYQPFDFVSAVKAGANNEMIVELNGKKSTLTFDSDFRPLGFSSDAKLTAPVFFAGYGITAPEKKYDDYENQDVKGKIVVVLRYGPDGNDIHSDYYRFTALRNKVRVAREKGAVGVIVVDPLEDDLIKLGYDQSFSSSGIPTVCMKRSILETWLAVMKKDLKSIQENIKANKVPVAFDLPGIKVDLQTEVVKVMAKTANVAGYLPGSDSRIKNEVMVLGAHFDHLGYGGEGSGSLKPDAHEIHNGADDNASGVAGMLELAQRFSTVKEPVKRTLLFIGFSGEELGTLGSQYYVNNPFFPLIATVAMLNMDMVGRLKDNVLTVQGVGTSSRWKELVRTQNSGTDTLAIKTVDDGFGPSDHASFYAKNIPVLFFFTGTHSDYHKPSDDWDKINYGGEERIVRYIYKLANTVQSTDTAIQFTKSITPATTMGGGDGRGFTVTLGVVPDYSSTVEGLRIEGTRAGGPAEKAGLKAGDVITKLAGKKVMNIYDYMGVLGELKAGDVVAIEALREGKSLSYSATMQKR